ncbi:MAG: hypothetical protein RLY21_619 [Planctomycetota bacterium]|jgi:hypothetical protein
MSLRSRPASCRLFASAALLAASLSFLTGCHQPTRAQYDAANGWSVYGSLVQTHREVDPEITAAEVGEYAGTDRRVVLSGTVSDVCRTMGCWLEIEDAEGNRVLVMNKDHAFFIPRNARGRLVHAVGFSIREEHSVEFLKHLAMDAGKSQAEIDAITEPKTRVLFIAEAVILPPGGLEKPVEPLPAENEIPAVDSSMTPTPTPSAEPAALEQTTSEPTATAEPKP